MNKNKLLYLILSSVLFLSACGGADDKKAGYFEKAQNWYDAEEFDKARIELQNVLQIDPKDIPARYLLAQVLEKTQDFRAAAKHYNGILEQDETHIGARIKLGEYFLLSQNIEKAKEYAEKALASDVNNADAFAFRGTIFLKQKDYASAKDDANRALEIEPDNIKATLLKANALNLTKKTGESIELLNKAIQVKPDNLLLRNLLSTIYVNIGKHEKAVEQVQYMIDKHPEVLFYRLKLADIYLAAGDKQHAEDSIRSSIKEFPDNNEIKLSLVRYIANEKGDESAIEELKKFISEKPDNYELKFVLASIYQKQGDTDNAISIYEEVIEKEKLAPDALNARIYLAELNSKLGKNDDAKSLLSVVLAETPNNHTALALRGQIYLSEGDALSSIADFRAAMRDQPNSTILLQSLAKAHLSNNELDLAIDLIKRAVKLKKEDLALREEYIRLLAVKGDTENIINQLDEVLNFAPDNLAAMEALFKVHASKKDWVALQQISEKMKQTHPENAIGYYFSGLQLMAQKQFEESISEFKQAIKLSPDTVEPVTQLVRIYLLLKKPELALESLDEIIKNNDKNFHANNLKGEIHVYNKNYDEAIIAFNNAIEIKPDWPLPYRNLAKCYLLKDKRDEVVAAYEKGIKATNYSPVLVAELARYFELNKELDKAIKLYEQVIINDEDNKLAINNLAMLLIDYKADKESLDRAASLVSKIEDPNNPAYLDTIGWLHFKQDNFDKAVEYLEKAVAAAPDNAGLNYHLGMAYFKAGKKEDARKSLLIATQTEEKYLGFDEASSTLENL